jgi:hypothetical protein
MRLRRSLLVLPALALVAALAPAGAQAGLAGGLGRTSRLAMGAGT